jgi:3-keto-5-aminohexanoate cleavage enzyme
MKEFGVRSEIENFDLSLRHGECRSADKGLLNERPHIQFVMGMQNALPAEEGLLETLLNEAKRLFPACTWTAAGIGRHQAQVVEWALAHEGQCGPHRARG